MPPLAAFVLGLGVGAWFSAAPELAAAFLVRRALTR